MGLLVVSEMRCQVHRYHSPVPLNSATHHILPRSWGGGDEAANLIRLCPTGHENVHTALNAIVRLGDPRSVAASDRGGGATWGLALKAWAARDGRPTPYTSGSG